VNQGWFVEKEMWFKHDCDMSRVEDEQEFSHIGLRSLATSLDQWEAEQYVKNERWLNSRWTIQESLLVGDFVCLGADSSGQVVETLYSALMALIARSLIKYGLSTVDADLQAFMQKLIPNIGVASLARLARRLGTGQADEEAYSYMTPAVAQRQSLGLGNRTLMDLTAACTDITVLCGNTKLNSERQCLWHETGISRDDIVCMNRSWHKTSIRFGRDVAYVYDPVDVEFTQGPLKDQRWVLLGSVCSVESGNYSTYLLGVRVTRAWRGSNMLHALECKLFNALEKHTAKFTTCLHECIPIGLTVDDSSELF
jgi:hypothetical protein